jgi:hypothetical protein
MQALPLSKLALKHIRATPAYALPRKTHSTPHTLHYRAASLQGAVLTFHFGQLRCNMFSIFFPFLRTFLFDTVLLATATWVRKPCHVETTMTHRESTVTVVTAAEFPAPLYRTLCRYSDKLDYKPNPGEADSVPSTRLI